MFERLKAKFRINGETQTIGAMVMLIEGKPMSEAKKAYQVATAIMALNPLVSEKHYGEIAQIHKHLHEILESMGYCLSGALKDGDPNRR